MKFPPGRPSGVVFLVAAVTVQQAGGRGVEREHRSALACLQEHNPGGRANRDEAVHELRDQLGQVELLADTLHHLDDLHLRPQPTPFAAGPHKSLHIGQGGVLGLPGLGVTQWLHLLWPRHLLGAGEGCAGVAPCTLRGRHGCRWRSPPGRVLGRGQPRARGVLGERRDQCPRPRPGCRECRRRGGCGHGGGGLLLWQVSVGGGLRHPRLELGVGLIGLLGGHHHGVGDAGNGAAGGQDVGEGALAGDAGAVVAHLLHLPHGLPLLELRTGELVVPHGPQEQLGLLRDPRRTFQGHRRDVRVATESCNVRHDLKVPHKGHQRGSLCPTVLGLQQQQDVAEVAA
eukprot:RCo024324